MGSAPPQVRFLQGGPPSRNLAHPLAWFRYNSRWKVTLSAEGIISYRLLLVLPVGLVAIFSFFWHFVYVFQSTPNHVKMAKRGALFFNLLSLLGRNPSEKWQQECRKSLRWRCRDSRSPQRSLWGTHSYSPSTSTEVQVSVSLWIHRSNQFWLYAMAVVVVLLTKVFRAWLACVKS